MSKSFTPSVTRRTFGTMLGAAAVATPSLVSAAGIARTPRDETILALYSVPLVWPQYHKVASFDVKPREGDTVVLKRTDTEPFDEQAIAIQSLAGEHMGYIPRRHNAAMSWALERGEARQARISRIAEPVVRGQRISGWGAIHIDVEVSAQALV